MSCDGMDGCGGVVMAVVKRFVGGMVAGLVLAAGFGAGAQAAGKGKQEQRKPMVVVARLLAALSSTKLPVPPPKMRW